MSKTFTLNKRQFIERAMNGEVFLHDGIRLFYDKEKHTPFRSGSSMLAGNWGLFNGEYPFTLEEPEPVMERRYIWRIDRTHHTVDSHYMTDACAASGSYVEDGWYKTNIYIDVEIKG